jgi:uncharacterized protein with PIN domain
MQLHKISFRFYGKLNRFIEHKKRYRVFSYTVKGEASLKDALQAIGAPHTEIDVVEVDGRVAPFSFPISQASTVLVYPCRPVFLKSKPKFICDVHLGKLARDLRLMGFDTAYQRDADDKTLLRMSQKDKRILLTRDIGILKNNQATRAAFVYATDPDKQWKEMIERFTLTKWAKPFSRCLECNGAIKRIAKTKVETLLPPKVKQYYDVFWRCMSCQKIYWHGSHYEKLVKLIKR